MAAADRRAEGDRRVRAAGRAPVAAPEVAAAGAEAELPDEELWGRVRALPEKQHQAVALRFLLDLEYADIGAAIEIGAGGGEAERVRGAADVARTRRSKSMKPTGVDERVASLPWPGLQAELDRCGFVQTPAVLSAGECAGSSRRRTRRGALGAP